MKSQTASNNLLFAGARLAFLAVAGIIFLGGLSDWVYINAQEYSISLSSSFVEYLSSYASAFLICGIEISASYYFMQKYDLGERKRMILISLLAGLIGFVAYLFGETLAGFESLGNASVPFLQLIYYELSPYYLDYGNALVILLSLFSLVLLVSLLLKINPLPKTNNAVLFNGTGFFGALWTSAITTVSAMVCCGPLPALILTATGILPIYFTYLIDIQSLLVLISVPLLVLAIALADKRAKKGCRLR